MEKGCFRSIPIGVLEDHRARAGAGPRRPLVLEISGVCAHGRQGVGFFGQPARIRYVSLVFGIEGASRRSRTRTLQLGALFPGVLTRGFEQAQRRHPPLTPTPPPAAQVNTAFLPNIGDTVGGH
jgi:hypothetical protein